MAKTFNVTIRGIGYLNGNVNINKTVDKAVPKEWKKTLKPLTDKINYDIRLNIY